MRALKLQKDNFIDDALSLFNELLQTEILFEVNLFCIHNTMIEKDAKKDFTKRKLLKFG